MPRPRSVPRSRPPVTALRAPEHLARRFQQICDSMLAGVFAAEGLVGWQYSLIPQLRATPGLDCTRLAAAIGRDATSTGQALDMLEVRGLVARRVSPEDRRAWSFALTPAGEAFHEGMRPRVTAISRRITAPLSPAEAGTFLDLLTRLVVEHETHARPGAGRRPPRRRGPAAAEAEGPSPCVTPAPAPPVAPRSASASSASSSAGGRARRSRSLPA
jgi:MarR family transcriptional regulator, temperature-dependent positive regulator of motility